MPWINQDKCSGCELCINSCPVSAISKKNDIVEINMEKCIRCGKCHSVCPQEAVRHDSEKIPQEISNNMEKTKELLKNYKNKIEKNAFLERMIKHYNKEMKVAKQTIEEIQIFQKEFD